jgi:hypothetical protein
MPPSSEPAKRRSPLDLGTGEKLIELGVPESKHNFDDLAAYFPPEFNIRAAQFDTETLAKVLIHLAKQGLIKLLGKRQSR